MRHAVPRIATLAFVALLLLPGRNLGADEASTRPRQRDATDIGVTATPTRWPSGRGTQTGRAHNSSHRRRMRAVRVSSVQVPFIEAP